MAAPDGSKSIKILQCNENLAVVDEWPLFRGAVIEEFHCITPFIEYVFNVTIKIIFYRSKIVCKIYKLSILMAVRGGGGHTKSNILLFIVQEKLEFSQEKVGKFYRQSCVGTLVIVQLLLLFLQTLL